MENGELNLIKRVVLTLASTLVRDVRGQLAQAFTSRLSRVDALKRKRREGGG